MFCPQCGANNSQEAKFCASCGAQLALAADQQLNNPPTRQQRQSSPDFGYEHVPQSLTLRFYMLFSCFCLALLSWLSTQWLAHLPFPHLKLKMWVMCSVF